MSTSSPFWFSRLISEYYHSYHRERAFQYIVYVFVYRMTVAVTLTDTIIWIHGQANESNLEFFVANQISNQACILQSIRLKNVLLGKCTHFQEIILHRSAAKLFKRRSTVVGSATKWNFLRSKLCCSVQPCGFSESWCH